MDYAYVAYNKERRLVRGKVSAPNEQTAANILNYGGYQVVNLKATPPLIDIGRLMAYFSPVSPRDILMLSRQLALLISSGIDIVASLELLQGQATNHTLKSAIGEIVTDLRNGKSLSTALSRHPSIFPAMYYRSIAAGEQGGSLDVILRQMADFLERTITTRKNVQGAMAYPAFLLIGSIIVVLILATFVLPSFTTLFESFGAKLPATTRILLDLVGWFGHYGVYVIAMVVAAVIAGYIYIRTPVGKYQWDRLSFSLPVLGRINLLNELSYCCRIVALLFRVGLPLPEILNLAIHGTTNKFMAEALTGVHRELVRGEGLSRPMSHRKVFLPLMVQMIAVGEETGRLDTSLITVAESYEMEAEDRTRLAIGLIQPTMTIVIGGVVTFVAVSLVSAMHGMYGQMAP